MNQKQENTEQFNVLLFRGMPKERNPNRYGSSQMVWGDILLINGKTYISENDTADFEETDFLKELVEVKPETIGQFIGKYDKNKKVIFIGDIVKWDPKEWGSEYSEVVEWDFELLNARQNDWPQFCEVIGNIHENKNLLEVKQ